MENIYSGVELPSQRQERHLKLRSLMQADEIGQMKMDEYQRGLAEENQLRELTRQSGGDLMKLRDLTYGAGNYKQGAALDKQIGEQKTQKLANDKGSLELQAKKWEMAGQIAGQVTDQASYDQANAWGQANGLPALPPQYDPAVVKKMQMGALTAQQQIAAKLAQDNADVSAANQVMTPDGEGGFKRNEPYITARKEMGKAGATVINNDLTPPLGKAGMTKVDEGLLDTTAQIMGLDQIQAQFKPEFLESGTRLKNTWSSIKAKGGVGLEPKEEKSLREFSQFRRASIDSLNKYIKSVTGAAMSEAEAQRILSGLPNPGSGIFDGDDPISFKAKLDDAIKASKMAAARYTYIKRSGGVLDVNAMEKEMPLERVPSIINERGAELENELKTRHKGLGAEEMKKAVRRQLAQEFGLIN